MPRYVYGKVEGTPQAVQS